MTSMQMILTMRIYRAAAGVILIAMIGGIGFSLTAHAQDNIPAYILDRVPDARPVGHGTLHYLVWDVYDTTLFAPQGRYDDSAPFALEIIYRHPATKARIIDATIDQMQDDGFTDQEKIKYLAQGYGQSFYLCRSRQRFNRHLSARPADLLFQKRPVQRLRRRSCVRQNLLRHLAIAPNDGTGFAPPTAW